MRYEHLNCRTGGRIASIISGDGDGIYSSITISSSLCPQLYMMIVYDLPVRTNIPITCAIFGFITAYTYRRIGSCAIIIYLVTDRYIPHLMVRRPKDLLGHAKTCYLRRCIIKYGDHL